jgi:ABC-type Na+ efflux pump permease subunit
VKLRHLSLIMKKDFSSLTNEKTILLAVLLQLFVAMFSSFLMVGLTSMYDPSAIAGYSGIEYQVGYSGEDSPFLDLLDNRDDIRVHRMDLSSAVTALKERQLAAVIYVPDTSPVAEEPVKITLYSLQNDIQGAIINAKLKEVFLEYEEYLRDLRRERLTVDPVPVQVPEKAGSSSFYEFVYGLLIPLLLFMPAIISAALVIDLICEEYEQHTFDTLLSTPITFTEVIWGKTCLAVLLVPLQVITWLGLLLVNGIYIAAIPLILLIVVASSAVLILTAVVTALYYRERTAAQVIFSMGVVILILAVLSLPENPFNLVAVLATGSVGSALDSIFALPIAAVCILAVVVSWYSSRIQGLG